MILKNKSHPGFRFVGLIILLLATLNSKGFTMSLLSHSEKEVVICSPIKGKITINNKPLVGAKVERFLKWKDETGEKDYVKTDENGFFNFTAKTEVTKLPKFAEFVAAQEIRVYVNGTEYPIWVKAKRETGMYAELGGEPINLRFELTDDLALVDAGLGTLMTLCKWDSIK